MIKKGVNESVKLKEFLSHSCFFYFYGALSIMISCNTFDMNDSSLAFKM